VVLPDDSLQLRFILQKLKKLAGVEGATILPWMGLGVRGAACSPDYNYHGRKNCVSTSGTESWGPGKTITHEGGVLLFQQKLFDANKGGIISTTIITGFMQRTDLGLQAHPTPWIPRELERDCVAFQSNLSNNCVSTPTNPSSPKRFCTCSRFLPPHSAQRTNSTSTWCCHHYHHTTVYTYCQVDPIQVCTL